MLTTMNGTDFVTTKPAVPDGTKALHWFRDPPSGGAGTPLNQDAMNDLAANLRQAATEAGVDLTSYARGSNAPLTDIIRALGGAGLDFAVSSAYNYSLIYGYQPLLRSALNQWFVPNGIAGEAAWRTGAALDATNTNKAANASVRGIEKGDMQCGLHLVNANGSRGARKTLSLSGTSIVGQAVYLVTTSNSPYFCYALLTDINPAQQWHRRCVGRVLFNDVSSQTVWVAFDMNSADSGQRTRVLWQDNATSGTQTLISGMRFSDYSSIMVLGGTDRTGLTGVNHLTPLMMPYGIFAAGFSIASQESHAADARWSVTRVSDTTFSIASRTNNLTTGVRYIIGVY